MTSKQITAVALKCLAIYLFSILSLTPWILHQSRWRGDMDLSTTAVAIACALITAGFALAAWRLANHVGSLVAKPPVDDIHVNITPQRLEVILFRVLGVYLTLTQFKACAVALLIERHAKLNVGLDTSEIQQQALASFAVLVAGLVLTLKPRPLIDLLDRMTKQTEAPTNESSATSEPAPGADSAAPHS
jgi:hypothetical protein